MSTFYMCPVCGYDRMVNPPEDYYLCPCCGTEFGYEDFAETHGERTQQWERLRLRWLREGALWFSPVTPPPAGWSPYPQLFRSGVGFRLESEPTRTTVLLKWGELVA